MNGIPEATQITLTQEERTQLAGLDLVVAIALRKLADQLVHGGRLFLVTDLADAVRPCELISKHWYFRIGGHLSLRHLNWLGAMLGLCVNSVRDNVTLQA
jgi:hypothetical protein